MGYRKKEKKSRLKDIEDLLEALPDKFKEPKGIPSEFDKDRLKKLLPELGKPKKEIPDWLKKFLEKNRPDLRKIKPVPLPEMIPDPDRIKPVPMPEVDPRFLWPPEGWKEDPRYRPKPDPRFLWPPEGWKEDPKYKPAPMPDEFLWPPRVREPQPFKPPRFDPKRGIDPKYLLEAGAEGESRITNIAGQELTPEEAGKLDDIHTLTITGEELYRMKLEQLGLPKNILLPMDKHIEIMDALRKLTEQGKGTYILDPDDPSSTRGMTFAGGGMMDINRMTAPLGYANGGQPITIEQIMRDAETSRGPAEVTHPIQKIISDRTIVDPYSVSQKERLKELGSKAKTGIETLKGLGSGAMSIGQELLGAGPAEATVSGMHPLIEFQEMYDQYIIDGGDMPFKEFFDMIQIELDKMAGE